MPNTSQLSTYQADLSSSNELLIITVMWTNPNLVTSNCVYQFTSTCQGTYIGRTEKSVSLRIVERIP